ncbi:hypothetical protein AJ78_08998 [Emergomyces pasteurianus Ep9510]|uniref:Uncharacterized protein n=1 Tax=Emergomyces pasteurianus Ep9510 TaxID=1447872 RepID=A0A1J9Q3A2_9EURO|nr:hypothetical protein AJ78_08998 [Emergomyces pasteurianus Ep9510]
MENFRVLLTYTLLNMGQPYLCISAAELLIPFHSSNTIPVRAREMINRGRETRATRSLKGGNLALVDFHVTPPLGSNISRRTRADWREATTERMGNGMDVRRERRRRSGLERA